MREFESSWLENVRNEGKMKIIYIYMHGGSRPEGFTAVNLVCGPKAVVAKKVITAENEI